MATSPAQRHVIDRLKANGASAPTRTVGLGKDDLGQALSDPVSLQMRISMG